MKMKLGEIIKIRRSEDNISLKEFADFLGISESMLSRIENGERRISPENLKKVAQYLKISEREINVYYLLDDIKTKFGSDSNFKEAIKRLNNEYN